MTVERKPSTCILHDFSAQLFILFFPTPVFSFFISSEELGTSCVPLLFQPNMSCLNNLIVCLTVDEQHVLKLTLEMLAN